MLIDIYFDEDFLKTPYEIAPLQAPKTSAAARHGMPFYAEEDKLFCGLPSFIADLLPDNWGNRVFDRWAREKGISKRHLSSLDRLAYIGKRGMGALEFVPSSVEEWEQPFKVEIDELYALATDTLEQAGSSWTACLNLSPRAYSRWAPLRVDVDPWL